MFFVFFEKGFLCVALAVLELTHRKTCAADVRAQPWRAEAAYRTSFLTALGMSSLSRAYPSGEFCIPNIILQEEKGAHSICRHFRHLLAVKEVWVS